MPGYEINEKLRDLLQGKSTSGYSAVAFISAAFSDTEDARLTKLIMDLRALVYCLNEHQRDIISQLLTLDWQQRNAQVVEEHSQLLISIAAAHACHLDQVLRFIIKQFIPNMALVNDSKNDADCPSFNKQLYCGVHKSIKVMLDVIPSCRLKFAKCLRETFPFVKRPVQQIRDYIQNLLLITTYAPQFRLDILEIITQELLKLDTSCSREALELEDRIRNGDDEMFPLEQEPNVQSSLDEGVDFRIKLDTCICIMFQYLSTIQTNASSAEVSQLYTELLEVFEASVLPVYSCHHVQYLWFVLCSSNSKFSEHFISWLWQHVLSPSVATVLRQNAAAYLGSYVARAQSIDIEVVKSHLQQWAKWIHNYMRSQECSQDKVHFHGTFHSVCQSVFYVIICRFKQLIALETGHDFLKLLNLDSVIASRFNPLRYCATDIVLRFANISRNYQFAFCYTIIERNRRTIIAERCRGSIVVSDMLDSSFPFDPCFLPRARELVAPFYRESDALSMEEDHSMIIVPKKEQKDDAYDFLEDMSPTNSYEEQSIIMREPLNYSASPGFRYG